MLIEPLSTVHEQGGSVSCSSRPTAATQGGPDDIPPRRELWIIGFVLFAQRGWQWPWTIAAHGILEAIAEAMLLFLPVVLLGRSRLLRGALVAGALTAVMMATDFALDAQDVRILVFGLYRCIIPYAIPTGATSPRIRCWMVARRRKPAFFFAGLCAAFTLAGWFRRRLRQAVRRVSTPANYLIAGDGFTQTWKLLTDQPSSQRALDTTAKLSSRCSLRCVRRSTAFLPCCDP